MPSATGVSQSSGSGHARNFEYRIRVEGRYELETEDAYRDARLVAELNGISTQIDDFVANEIETYLPSSVKVNRVTSRFRVGSLNVDSVVSFIGNIADILTVAEYVVRLTRWVYERLPKDLRDANLVDIPVVKTAEVRASALDAIPPQPSSRNNSGLSNSQISFGGVLQIVTLMLASAIVLLVLMMAVLVIRYGLF